MSTIMFAIKIFLLAALVVSIEASTTPHRLFPLETPLAQAAILTKHNHIKSIELDTEDNHHILSIIEGASIDTSLNSSSYITLNLNRAIDEDVTVSLRIYSGPQLIEFESGNFSHVITNSSNGTDPAGSKDVVFKANTFGDMPVRFSTKNQSGHAEIVCTVKNQPKKANITIDDTSAYISINIYRYWNLNIIIHIVGWIYFFAWSASFYFQIILNYRRKSVIGLNFDFIALNVLGFTCYSIYNASLLFSHTVQSKYYQRYTYTRIPVEFNDLFFSVHAFIMSAITLVQCVIYERGEQRVSIPATLFVGISTILGVGLYVASIFNRLTILDVILYLSNVKLLITTIKYTPQAFMNYRRKATTGWSIHNILLDFTGGTFSLAQMFFIAYNYNDWISIFGNFTKFGLAIISICFDILFMIQHYVLYKSDDSLEEDSVDRLNPVISESIRSAPQQHQPPTPGLRNEQSRFAPHPPHQNAPDSGFENRTYESED